MDVFHKLSGAQGLGPALQRGTRCEREDSRVGGKAHLRKIWRKRTFVQNKKTAERVPVGCEPHQKQEKFGVFFENQANLTLS